MKFSFSQRIRNAGQMNIHSPLVSQLKISNTHLNIISSLCVMAPNQQAMKKIYTLLTLLISLGACMDRDGMEIQNANFPLGIWSDISYQQDGFTMNKTIKLQENTLGYVFKANGTLIHRANSGWCGTPPIITNDFSGKWKLKGNRLTMEVAFWGGTMLQVWEITDLGDGRASIKVLSQEVKG